MSDRSSDLLDQVRAALERAQTLRIRGGGSKDWYGEPWNAAQPAELLDTRAHCGIVEYEPSELVITARCGTPLSELEATLSRHRQMLACEPPHFGPAATVGGCIAAGLSGPRRASSGSIRDFVLGAKLINGRGQHLSFGGRVIKNVAGYDVSRLLAGSLGILGVVTEVSLKVVPIPAVEATLRFHPVDAAEAVRRLNRWAAQPLPVSASVWHADTLHLRLSGAHAAVSAARTALGGEALEPDHADDLWRSLREQTHAFFGSVGQPAALWRLALPSVAAAIDLPGAGPAGMIEWGGAQRWLMSDAAALDIRAAAAALGGHATLFRSGADQPRDTPRFTPLDPVTAGIHRRLKAEFDPAGIFNPGRLIPGL